jgi:predicted aconitase with swiveling domain
VLAEPLSFWGGVDAGSGVVIDRRHPQAGSSVRGTILVMPSGRGSSSSSTVLAEALRSGTGPAAILLLEPDPILVLGAFVAEDLYGRTCPVVVLEPGAAQPIVSGDWLSVEAPEAGGGAEVRVSSPGPPAALL